MACKKCEDCEWNKRDPKQLSKVITEFKAKFDGMERQILNLKTKVMMFEGGNKKERANKSSTDIVQDDFSDDDIPF